MPTIENSETGGGRVTRSLRKRLTSVDTDSSSRPGTPLLSNLQTVQEAVMTPSKRTTRRTSMSTPVPTPSKVKSRMDVSEVVNSPARRNTRRRSLSTQEHEETTTQTKSKEPAFDVVKEEEPVEKSPEHKSKTTSLISPRSTLIRQGERTRSETPTSEKSQKYISPEVSPHVLKHMKHSKVMLKKEHIDETNSNAQRGSPNLKNKQLGSKETTPQKNSPTTAVSSPEKEQSSKQNDTEQNPAVEKQPTPTKALETSLKSDDAKSDINTSMHHTPSKKRVEDSSKESNLTGNDTTLSATETQHSPMNKKKGRPSNLKSVGFNNTAEEDEEKSVFPKTPGLTKSKSYILDSSKPDVNESISKSETKLEEDSTEDTEKHSVKEDAVEDDNEILSSKTPYKLKLASVESSTPIQSTSSKKSKNESEQKDTSIKESEGSKKDFAFPKSWSHSVSGTVNDLVKIDSIESEERSQKKLEEENAINKSANSSKSSKHKRSLHDDSDEDLIEDDDLLLGDDDEDEEEEQMEREKSMFVDDEAMEVAEGEESMDSEERAYLEENEIPVYAESIGSEDTVEDECEEEGDEEDAAFVVSDTEDILHEESDSDDGKKVNKKYKRIVRNVDSSDEESVAEKGKDDDICLIVDSSVDDVINVSTTDKVDTNSNVAEILNNSKKIKNDSETAMGETSFSLLMKSVKDPSLKNNEDDQKKNLVSYEIKTKGKEHLQTDYDNGSAMDEETSDGGSSKKEWKSLGNRKSLGAEQKYIVASQEDNIDLGDDMSVKTKEQEEEADGETDTDPEVKNKLSKRERKSLSLTKARDAERKSLTSKNGEHNEDKPVNSPNKRKSLRNQEEDPIEDNEDKPVNSPNKRKSLKNQKEVLIEDSEDKSLNSPNKRKSLRNQEQDPIEDNEDKAVNRLNKRKSLRNQEEVSIEDVIRDDTETEEQRSSLEDTDANTDVEIQTSKLSKKERKSLSKSKADASKVDPMCSPYKRKSLKGQETESEPRTPNKTSLQEESANSGRNLSKKERKSLNKVQELSDQDVADVEMFDIEKSTEIEAEETCTEGLKNASVSLNKSRSEKRKNDVEDSEKESDKDVGHESPNEEHDEVANLSENQSLHNTDSDTEQAQGASVQSDGEDKFDHVDSPARSDKSSPKSPKLKNSSPLKKPRKSLNKSVVADVGCEQVSEEKEYVEENASDVSQNSLNTSKNKRRKSLKRTSTEEVSDDTEEREPERPANKSKSEMSVLFVEDDSETEATSALEVSSKVTEEKPQNSPRISRKSMNQSISNKKEEDVKQSPRKPIQTASNSENDDENGETPNPESDDDNEMYSPEISKVMEFLGEEEFENNSSPILNSSRRKSLNKSKLDETFHLEPNNSSLSRRDSLHRNLLKKSLNHSKLLSESMKKTKARSADEDVDDDADNSTDDDADVSAMFSDDEEEEVEIVKKVLPDRGLSVSLSGIERKKKNSKGAGEQVHKSFTIGVSLRHSVASPDENDNISPDSLESHGNVSVGERDDLEKVENVEVVGPYKPRNSLSMKSLNESTTKPKSKRFSLYVPQEAVSQSFIENLAEEKKKLHSKKSRKSNSFCGVIDPCEEPEAETEESEPPKSQTQSSETSKSEAKTDIQRILSRCDEILEAANRAKREAKLNAKKTKVKKPKWMEKEENVKEEEEEVKIPLVSKKEIKRKEKMKKELAKAIKHSTAMLKTIDPILVKKLKAEPEVEPEPEVTAKPKISSKRLPADFLDELDEAPKPKKKKTKEIESTPPSDKENSKRSYNKTQPRSEGIFDGEKKKKKRSKEILETASGTVIVEPATPNKLRYQNGFRESPKTPVGFKIQDVDDSNGTDREKSKKKAKKLFTASGSFEEKDLSHSNLKTASKKSKKRKLHIEEPVYSLPKTQWTSSGVFVEEDIYTVHHPLANSTATQFMVSSLSGSKKSKSSKVVSSATLSSALNFKKNALFSEKVKRESARSLIHRNERKLINNRY